MAVVTMEKIADKANVSRSTVSRILFSESHDYNFPQETVEHVMKTAKNLGYRPNQLARGLKTKKTKLIGVVIADICSPFYGKIAWTIERKAHQLGYNVIVCNSAEDYKTEIKYVDMLKEKMVDGLIISPSVIEDKHLAQLVNERFPLVLIDRYIKGVDTHYVIADNVKGAYEATSLLLELGHQRIGFVSGRKVDSSMQDRMEGYKNAISGKGITIDEELIVGNGSTKEAGYMAAKQLLRLNPHPTAIFGANDLITIGILNAIGEQNMRIPEDISVIGFDDFDLAPLLKVPLTVIAQPIEEIGKVALEVLLRHINDKGSNGKEPEKIVLKTKLIKRESCCALTP